MTDPIVPISLRRLGVLTGGGDAPGLNAAVRAVVKAATLARIEPVGIADGFDGLLAPASARVLRMSDVVGILREGGTLLGTTNHGRPENVAGQAEHTRRLLDGCRALNLDALVVIGGDGSLAMAHDLHQGGMPVVAVPKTIDNDVAGTTATVGFDTAVATATDAIDRLHTTAQAHHRVMVIEVMGRYTGWIALYSGIAGGADVVLIPELPYDVRKVAGRILEREAFGARFSVVAAAEGARAIGGERIVAEVAAGGRAEKLGGIAEYVSHQIEALTGKESRHVVLGHLQRGGRPTSADRVLATRLGAFAVGLVQRSAFGTMAALCDDAIVPVPLARVVGQVRTVPVDSDVVRTARRIGISFGD